MAIVDPTLLLRACKLFPELTQQEMEVGILYCSGFNRENLAEVKDISLRRVDFLLKSIRRKLNLKDNEWIKATVNARALLHLLKF